MVRPIEVLIVGDETSLARALGKAQSNLNSFESRMTRTGKSLTHVGHTLTRDLTLPIVGVGVASAKLALDFGTAMERVQGLTGASAKQTEEWSHQLLALGPKVAQTPKQLADTLYFVASSGAKVNQVLPITAQAARDAAAGMGDAQTVAQLLTSAMNAYGAKALSARSASDALTEAIKIGKAEPADLAASLGRVIPVAQAMGVRFQEVAGTVAELTNTGLSADEAVTAVRATLTGLLKPTAQTVSVLNDLGLSAAGVRREIRDKGLNTTLQDLANRVGDNKDQLGKLFPNVRALAGFLALTGQNAGNVRDALDKMNNSVGASDKAFQTASQSADFKLRSSLASLETTGIQLGNTLLPVFAGIAKDVAGVAKAFDGLSPPEQKAVIATLGFTAALGPIASTAGNVAKAIGQIGDSTSQTRRAFSALITGATAFGPWGVVIYGAVAAVSAEMLLARTSTSQMGQAMQDARHAADELGGALRGLKTSNLDVRQAELDRTNAVVRLADVTKHQTQLIREGKKGSKEYAAGEREVLQAQLDVGVATANLTNEREKQTKAQNLVASANRASLRSLTELSKASQHQAGVVDKVNALSYVNASVTQRAALHTRLAATATGIFTGKAGELARSEVDLAKKLASTDREASLAHGKTAALALAAVDLTRKLGHIPTAHRINVYYRHNMAQLIEQARILAGEISSIPSTHTVSIQFAQAHGTALTRSGGGRQHGGPVTAGYPYIVGERRAELFVPNQSGRIMPRVPAFAGDGGGSSSSVRDIHIHFDGPVFSTNDAEVDKFARRIAPRIKRYF